MNTTTYTEYAKLALLVSRRAGHWATAQPDGTVEQAGVAGVGGKKFYVLTEAQKHIDDQIRKTIPTGPPVRHLIESLEKDLVAEDGKVNHEKLTNLRVSL